MVYVRVTQEEYPELFHTIESLALAENIDPPPSVFVTDQPEHPLGYARFNPDTLFIDQKSLEIFDQNEMTALLAHEMHHLKLGPCSSPEESRRHEYLCDQAAVQATDYKTISSYTKKAASYRMRTAFGGTLIGKTAAHINNRLPFSLASAFPFRLDKWHPSPASRMHRMRERASSSPPTADL